MPKLLNLMNVKMVPYIKENKHILDISLDMCFLLFDIAIVDHYGVFVPFIVFPHDALMCFVREWSP